MFIEVGSLSAQRLKFRFGFGPGRFAAFINSGGELVQIPGENVEVTLHCGGEFTSLREGVVLHVLRGHFGYEGLVGTSEFNLGEPDDYRVPDGGYHRSLPSEVFVPTAAIVVEVLSPGDETWLKFDFYARHGVDEICIADPRAREIRWFRLAGDGYEEIDDSDLLGVSAADLVAAIDWPR